MKNDEIVLHTKLEMEECRFWGEEVTITWKQMKR